MYSVQFVVRYFARGGLLMDETYQVAGPRLYASADLCNNAKRNPHPMKKSADVATSALKLQCTTMYC